MLIGISPLIGPDLLSALYCMGHGDEIVLADAHFPGNSINSRVIRADGLAVNDLLMAIILLIKLDDAVENPVTMMSPTVGDTYDENVAQTYFNSISTIWPKTPPIRFIERQQFYERARNAYVVVMTGETAKYGNILLKKGVTPIG